MNILNPLRWFSHPKRVPGELIKQFEPFLNLVIKHYDELVKIEDKLKKKRKLKQHLDLESFNEGEEDIEPNEMSNPNEPHKPSYFG